MENKGVDVNKLAMELITSKRWLLSVVDNLAHLSAEEERQYEYTLLWVQTQQKLLDELEWEGIDGESEKAGKQESETCVLNPSLAFLLSCSLAFFL